MKPLEFSTTRFICRPLGDDDISAFVDLVNAPRFQKFFKVGDPADFLNGLKQYDCYPKGVFFTTFGGDPPKWNYELVGYINGYVYNQSNREMLVEFFLTDTFYNFDCVKELLRAFLHYCRELGFCTLRFELDSEDEDVALLLNISSVHGIPEEDYTDEQSGRYIRVFKIFD